MNTEADNYPIMQSGQVIALGRAFPQGDVRLLRHPYRMRHFYYPINDIKEEVYKRTSVIGSKRHTTGDNSTVPYPQLIDYYSLSDDESKSFDALCKTASAKIFDVLIGHTDRRINSFLYSEGDVAFSKMENNKLSVSFTSIVPSFTTSVLTFYRVKANSLSSGANELGIERFLVSKGYTYEKAVDTINKLYDGEMVILFDEITSSTEAGDLATEASRVGIVTQGYEPSRQETRYKINVSATWSTGESTVTNNDKFLFHIVARYVVTNYMGERELRSIEQDIVFTPTSLTNPLSHTFSLEVKIDTSSPILPSYYAEAFVGVLDARVTKWRVLDKVPEIYPALSYIEYTTLSGEKLLYQAKRNTDSNADFNDTDIFYKAETDFRGSIHYILKRPLYENPNSDNTLDNAIFESLVTYVLCNWLQIIEPNNADTGTYKTMYADAMLDVKTRLNTTNSFRHLSYPY